MKEIETGKEKIQKICDLLRKETLDPAKQEAREIVENAELQAKQILEKAKEDAAEQLHLAKEKIVKKQKMFDDSLQFAARQAVEELKQAIEKRFFRENLREIIQEKMASPDVIAQLLTAIVEAIRKEGIESTLIAFVSQKVSSEKITALLGAQILAQLKNKELVLGDFGGGVKVRLVEGNMTIDLSDETLRDLVVNYIREDFRQLFFQK